MTDGHLTDDAVVDGHLTDEQLSSHLDGRGAGPERAAAASIGAHLEGCGRCRRRLAALESVRVRLRGSVEPLSPRVRADSIDAVLRAARDEDRNGERGADGDGDGDRTTGGEDHGTTPIPLSRRPQVIVGAAAAILVLAGAVGIPLALSHKGSSTASEASRVPGAATPPTTAGTGAVGSGVQVFSDLGTLHSTGALRSKVAGLLPVASSAAPAPTAASAATGTSAAAAAGTPHSGSTSTVQSGKAVNGPLDFSAAGSSTRAQIDRCLSAASGAGGADRMLVAVATATFRGTPALVYVFGPESPPSGSASSASSLSSERSRLVATARDGCKVLTTTPV